MSGPAAKRIRADVNHVHPLAATAAWLALLPLASRGEDLMDAYRQAIANDPVLSSASAAQRVTAENVPQARSGPAAPAVGRDWGWSKSTAVAATSPAPTATSCPPGSAATRASAHLSGALRQPLIDVAAIARSRAAHASDDAGEQGCIARRCSGSTCECPAPISTCWWRRIRWTRSAPTRTPTSRSLSSPACVSRMAWRWPPTSASRRPTTCTSNPSASARKST